MAELMLLYQRRDLFSPKRLIISVIISMIAGLYAFWTIVGSGQEIVYYGTLLMLSGIPMYVWVKWRDFSRERAREEVEQALQE
jgi:APA family basic amino acid/polyamine antiporter